MNQVIDKIDISTLGITELIEEAKKPMSLKEIQAKFNATFPFKVKKVQGYLSGNIFTMEKIISSSEDLGHKGCFISWTPSPRAVGHYHTKECTHCLGLSDASSSWNPDAKAWLFVGEENKK